MTTAWPGAVCDTVPSPGRRIVHREKHFDRGEEEFCQETLEGITKEAKRRGQIPCKYLSSSTPSHYICLRRHFTLHKMKASPNLYLHGIIFINFLLSPFKNISFLVRLYFHLKKMKENCRERMCSSFLPLSCRFLSTWKDENGNISLKGRFNQGRCEPEPSADRNPGKGDEEVFWEAIRRTSCHLLRGSYVQA